MIEKHEDAGMRCAVWHPEGGGQCIKCVKCGKWIRPKDWDLPCPGKPEPQEATK